MCVCVCVCVKVIDRWSHFLGDRIEIYKNEIVVDLVSRSQPIANVNQCGQSIGRWFLSAETRSLQIAVRSARHAAHPRRNVSRRRRFRRSRKRSRSFTSKTHFYGRVSFTTNKMKSEFHLLFYGLPCLLDPHRERERLYCFNGRVSCRINMLMCAHCWS